MNIPASTLRWRYYGGVPALVAVVVASCLGTLFLVLGYFGFQTEEEYGKNGVAANARVTRKEQKKDSAKGRKGGPKTTYRIHYRYEDEQGQAHEGGDNVDANVWNQFQKDQVLQIEYLRDEANKSRIVVSRSFVQQWGYLLALGGGSVLITGVLVFGIGGWFWAGRKARLVRDGVPFLGVVTEHLTRTSGSRSPRTSYRLQFTFTDASGTEQTGKSVWLPHGMEERWPIDEPILVLQDPNNPRRFEADIYEARGDDLAGLSE